MAIDKEKVKQQMVQNLQFDDKTIMEVLKHSDSLAKSIARLVEKSDIDEIEINNFWGAQKIRVSKRKCSGKVIAQAPVVQAPISAPSPVTNPVESSENKTETEVVESSNDNMLEIKAPLVGTMYVSPKPGDPPFVKKGDRVEKGQALCIIESMKIFNEIESEFDGVIADILVHDGEPVEYDQPLFLIES